MSIAKQLEDELIVMRSAVNTRGQRLVDVDHQWKTQCFKKAEEVGIAKRAEQSAAGVRINADQIRATAASVGADPVDARQAANREWADKVQATVNPKTGQRFHAEQTPAGELIRGTLAKVRAAVHAGADIPQDAVAVLRDAMKA